MEVQVEQGSSAWLAVRRRGITASDAGVVCGVSPYASAHSLWLVKCGLQERDSASEATAFGQRLEAGVVGAYEQLTGNSVRSARFYWLSETCPIGASPDG